MMKALNKQAFVRQRSDGGSYGANGKWTNGNLVDLDIRGSLQPIGNLAQEIQKVLPSGVRMDDVRVLYTRTELRVGNDRTGIEADNVVYSNPLTGRDEVYEVFRVDPWTALHRLSHFKAFIFLKDRDKV
jgi:hypothetical protein